MPSIQESPTQLTIKSFARTRRLILAIVLLLLGLLIVFAVPAKLLQMREIEPPPIRILRERGFDPPTPAELLARLSDESGRTLIRGQRPILLPGILSLIAGAVLLFSYTTGQTIIFDKPSRQVSIKQSHRPFRTQVSHFDFDDITDIRIDRNRAYLSKGPNNFTVRLEFDLNNPDAIQPSDFVYKRQWLLTRYRLDQGEAQAIVDRVNAFVGQGAVNEMHS